MKACFVAAVMTVTGLAGMLGEAVAQNYPSGPYAPPGSNRAAPILDDDDDLFAVPAPGPYGRPSATPYPLDIQRPPTAIQREALPMPGIAPREPSSAIVSAAISNAVFDAIGVRLRSVPFTPKKTLAAIKS